MTELNVTAYFPLLENCVSRFLRRGDVRQLGGTDAIRSAAYHGLLRAQRTYHAEKGAQFATYAYRCIKGEMLEWARICARQRRVPTLPLDEVLGDEETDTARLRCLRDPRQEFADTALIGLTVREALFRLRSRHREVLVLRFYANYTLQEVGACLGVTDSRIEQLQREALGQLKLALEFEEGG